MGKKRKYELVTKIECISMAGFIQMIVNLIGQGYNYYHVMVYPEKKQHKFHLIDIKLAEKYEANMERNKAYRSRRMGKSSYRLLRWGQLAILLKTNGESSPNEDDQFSDVRNSSLKLRVGEFTVLDVRYTDSGTLSVYIEKCCYRNIKTELMELCFLKDAGRIYYIYDRLNGFPNYKGIIKQKQWLKKFIINHAKKNQFFLDENKIVVKTIKRTKTVFSE